MKGKLLAFGVSLLAMATIGVVQLQTKAVDSSRDCDRFAVIRCGALSGDELRAEYDTNNAAGANGYTTAQGDIKKIFTAMGISRSDLQGNFKQGIVYKNGNVEVDGKVVATNAMIAARGLGGAQIEGTQAQKVSANAMAEAQTALVKVDQNGRFLYAVMKPCGNPVSATPKQQPTPEPQPQPVAKCVSVTVTQQERTKYLIKVTANAKDGAKIKGYTIKLHRGSDVIIDKTYPSTIESQSVVYVVETPGEYKVKATVDTSEGVKGGPACEATFTVPAPTTITETPPPNPVPAVDITKHVDGTKKYLRVNANVEFTYTIAVRNTGNVDLDNVVVTDTPDRAITLVSVTPPSGKIVNNSFVYTVPKLLKGETRTFALTAKVPASQAGRLLNTVCVDAPAVPGNPDKCDKAEVEVPPVPVPGKIEVCLKNEDRIIQITENEYDDQVHSRNFDDCDEQVVAVAELPQTGPAETVMSAFGAMSMVGAGAYYVTSRRHAGR